MRLIAAVRSFYSWEAVDLCGRDEPLLTSLQATQERIIVVSPKQLPPVAGRRLDVQHDLMVSGCVLVLTLSAISEQNVKVTHGAKRRTKAKELPLLWIEHSTSRNRM